MQELIFPRKIITGEGSLSSIDKLIKQFCSKRIIIFADPSIVKIGLTDSIERILKENNILYKLFFDIKPEPSIKAGDNAIQMVREFKADLVIGIGGGSCLDCAKVSAALATNEGAISDYLNLTGTKKLIKPSIKKILIPTTAGTGAEVTHNVVFSLGNTKDVISDENLLADVAIIDPELTYSMPSVVTAASGIDALTHALEAYVSKGSTALTDSLALEAIRKIKQNILTAVWNGSDRMARNEMAWGSLIASMSYFNAGVHGVHALSYPLGGYYKVPHGESNAVLLPYVLNYIWPSCFDKIKDIALALEVKIEGKSDQDIAMDVSRTLYLLVEKAGLPTTIKDYKVSESDIDFLANEGFKQKRLLSACPYQLNLEDIKNIYRSAYEGSIFNIGLSNPL